MKARHLLLVLLVPSVVGGALGPRYGGEVTVGVAELPASLAPDVPREAGTRLLAGLVHETLVGLGPDGLPVPALVAGWTTAVGGRELTLTLREGARFHDQRPLDSGDAVRSLRRFLRSPSAAGARLARSLEGGLAYRSGARDDQPGLLSVDPRRLVLRFVEGQALPLAPLASPAASVTSPNGAGCGPFVPTVTLPGRRISLTAFGAHVRGRPYLDRVHVAALPDPAALHAEALAGRLDLAPGEPGASALAATLLLVLAPDRAPFRDRDARTQAASAIDRAALASLIPEAEPVASLIAPSLLPPLGSTEPPRAGPLGGRVSLAVATDVPPLVSQRVVAHLAALGLGVRVLPSAPGTVLAVPADARLLLWSPEVSEAGLALEELAAVAPEVPAARAALDAAAVEPDLDQRRLQLHRAEAALRAQQVLVPLGAVPVRFGGRRAVNDLRIDLTARLVLENAWVEP